MRITKKNIQNKKLPHELFLTARKETKIRSAFAMNMWTDIKLSKAQLYKMMIQSGGFLRGILGSLGNLGKAAITNLAVSLAKDVLPGLGSNMDSNTTSNKLRRKVNGKGAVKVGKGFTFFDFK